MPAGPRTYTSAHAEHILWRCLLGCLLRCTSSTPCPTRTCPLCSSQAGVPAAALAGAQSRVHACNQGALSLLHQRIVHSIFLPAFCLLNCILHSWFRGT